MNLPELNLSLEECRAEHPALVARVIHLVENTPPEHGHYAETHMVAYREGVKTGRWLESKEKTLKKSSIPPLKPANITRYISAIPRAVASGELTAAQGNHLLYAAQTLISLLRLSQKAPPPPTPLGFDAPTKGKNER